MISINFEYCRENEYTYLKDIEFAFQHDELLLIDLYEGSLLWPLDAIERDKSKILYEIVKKSKNKKIIYLCSDSNIFQRIEKWKNIIDFDTPELEIICFPLSILIPFDQLTESSINDLNSQEKDKNFIALTSGPKDFRILTLDRYYKHEFFEYSYVPVFHWTDHKGIDYNIKNWYNFLENNFDFKNHVKFLTELCNDKKEHEKITYNGNTYYKENFNIWLPSENFQTCCDIVLESYVVGPTFITEKTFKEFVFKRPFLLLGSPGINQSLKELGFELYDDVFDYSFDFEIDSHKRLNKFWNEIDRFINLRPERFNEMLNVLEDKIEYNRKKYIEWYYNYVFNVPKNVGKILFCEDVESPTVEVSEETVTEIKKYCDIFK